MDKTATYSLFLIIALGLLGYLTLGANRAPESALLPDQADIYSEIPPYSQDHAEIRVRSFSQLGAEFERPDSLSGDSDSNTTNESAAKSDADALLEKFGSREEMFEARDAENEAVEELGLMETRDGFEVYMNESFEQEPIDSDWAYDYESLLYEAFANDLVLSGKPIEAIECRSVRCRVQIQLHETEDVKEVTQILVGKLVQGAEGLNYAKFWSSYSVEDNIGTWYIGRDREVDILQADKAN